MISYAQPDEASGPARDPRVTSSRLPLLAIAFLILTSAVILLTSCYEPLRLDEFLELQTDNVSSIRQLIHVQLTSPISLDPLIYHLFAHGTLRLFGPSAFALRLPSFLGYLLMQVCLFIFVRRIASERAAIFALTFPALTLALYFSSEGRPYGLQLGFFALVLVCWQSVARRSAERVPALVTLALSIALALNTHYFGVLLLVPLCAAELWRTMERKRLDWPVLASIAAGMAGILCTVPFMKPAQEFRQNYYNAAVFNANFIPRAYRDFFVHTTKEPGIAITLGLVIFAAVLLWMCARLVRSRTILLPRAEAVFVMLLAALPVLGFLLARFVTHSIEVRFVLGAITGISVLLAAALSQVLRRGGGVIVFILLAVVIGGRGAHLVLKDRKALGELKASMVLTPEIERALLASPTGLLYFQDVHAFDVATYYEHDPAVRSRLVLAYSRDQELRWHHFDTMSLTAVHMGKFTGLRVVPYESLLSQPGDHIFVLSHGDMEWLDASFAVARPEVKPLGAGLEGQAAAVDFSPPGEPRTALPVTVR